jgi:hypothetical protein
LAGDDDADEDDDDEVDGCAQFAGAPRQCRGTEGCVFNRADRSCARCSYLCGPPLLSVFPYRIVCTRTCK